jgi:hypothetical protein
MGVAEFLRERRTRPFQQHCKQTDLNLDVACPISFKIRRNQNKYETRDFRNLKINNVDI